VKSLIYFKNGKCRVASREPYGFLTPALVAVMILGTLTLMLACSEEGASYVSIEQVSIIEQDNMDNVTFLVSNMMDFNVSCTVSVVAGKSSESRELTLLAGENIWFWIYMKMPEGRRVVKIGSNCQRTAHNQTF